MPTVLLVDDHELMLELERTFLERSEFHVITAHDGPSGIAAAAEHRPDVVVMDHEMPHMSGPRAIRKMRKNPDLSETKFLLATALPVQADTPYADASIRKPFNPVDFLEAIRSLLNVPTRRAERFEVRLPVEWACGPDEGKAETRDLSTVGMLMTGPNLPPLGARIEARLDVSPPDSRGPRFDTIGAVVRTATVDKGGNPAVGVDFDSLTPGQLAVLEARLGIKKSE